MNSLIPKKCMPMEIDCFRDCEVKTGLKSIFMTKYLLHHINQPQRSGISDSVIYSVSVFT